MNEFKSNWFTETGVLNSNTATFSLKVDRILHEEKSKYQDILVFENKLAGKCLVLNNAIQCTELDEFSYQESIAFLPLNSHPNPKRVLIIGGGDGGVAREVLKHPLVDEVSLCEIDEAVVNVAKKYFPKLAESYDNPRLKVHIGDGIEFVQNYKDYFDVIITDSSDPIGPAECLFTKSYYEYLHDSLRSGGIICSQCESYWFDLEFVKRIYRTSAKLYKTVAYATIAIPTYPSGQIGFLIACKDKLIDFTEPVYKFSAKNIDSMQLKYYSEAMHKASFILPNFVVQALKQESNENGNEKSD